MSADDRLTIMDMVARADDLATARDVDEYVALFSAGGVIVGSEGDLVGIDAIRAGVRAIWAHEPDGTHHLSSTITVVEDGAAGAIARSTLLLVAGTPPQITAVVAISQRFENTAAGWRIARREIHAPSSSLGFPDHAKGLR